MGWQPNYQTEAKIYAKYIVENHPNAKIGILYQNDDYGKDYLVGFKEGLQSSIQKAALGSGKGPKIVSEQSYETADPTVDSQIVNLKNSGADAFFNITTPKFAAQAIKKAADIGWKPTHFLNNVSISIASVLKPAGFQNADEIISTTYGKDPDDAEWSTDPGIVEWRAFMQKYYPEGSLHNNSNVYGYAVAKTLEQVLRQCGDNLTRENVMKQAASLKNFVLPTSLPGISINTSPTDFAPIEQMQLQRFDAKKEQWIRFGGIIGIDEA
jgi:branched-chain amino acid transport system substrate-binding protein